MNTNSVDTLVQILVEQTPQAASEWLAWYFVSNIIGLCFFLGIVIGALIYLMKIKKDECEWELKRFICLLVAFIFGLGVFCCFFECVKVKMYPKAALIDKVFTK